MTLVTKKYPTVRAVLVAAFFLMATVTVQVAAAAGQQQQKRAVQLVNEAGVSVDVFWVHPTTGETYNMNDNDEHLLASDTIELNSFAGHEFELRELAVNGECSASPTQQCRRAIFKVSDKDDQRVFLTDSFEVAREDSATKAQKAASDMISQCHTRVKRAGAAVSQEQSMEILLNCVEESVASNLMMHREEIAFQSTVRKDMAAKLENYTCTDSDAPTSEPVAIEQWDGAADHQTRTVFVMHDRPASQIHVVQNFIDQEECDAMEEAAKPILHRATVADGSGGSKYSEARKAMQAGIEVPWEKEADGNAIARLSRRVYDYTNHVLGLNIQHHGQEDLMSIQYFGRGYNDTEPDRYTPHCDGDCTGLPHKHGTRMATMVMYCKVPTGGGHTNFRNSGVHVKPQFGNAIFFSYIDPETKVMDTGYTEHSGCPVFEGEKKIVTQWIRYGVDIENPWDSFNTLGIKKSEEKDY